MMGAEIKPGDRVKAKVGTPCHGISPGNRGTVVEIDPEDSLVRWHTDRGFRARYAPSELEIINPALSRRE